MILLLETNILSGLMNPLPDPTLVRWLNGQRSDSIWISSVTLYEARYGLELMPVGRRRDYLWQRLDAIVRVDSGNRVKYFDAVPATEAAKLGAIRKATGRPVDVRDLFIASIAISVRAAVVTRNVRHFSDLTVPVISPWDELTVN